MGHWMMAMHRDRDKGACGDHQSGAAARSRELVPAPPERPQSSMRRSHPPEGLLPQAASARSPASDRAARTTSAHGNDLRAGVQAQ
jgi:hypothetical protein